MASTFDSAKACQACEKKFHFLLNFKFPCAACGGAFCKDCSNHFLVIEMGDVAAGVDLRRRDFSKPQRCCPQCVARIHEKHSQKSSNTTPVQLPHTFSARFKLGNVLGEGGFAVVKEGCSVIDDKPVAIKIVKREGLSEGDQQAIFHEVEILSKIHHTNIVQLFDFFEEPEQFFIIMERIRGGELFDRIVQKTCYSEKEARDLTVILLHAIKYLHDRNIVHRDLKPENLLLTSPEDDADVKLVDFGFATTAEGLSITEQVGTPGYIAPEIINAEAYGKPVDMWSFGVVLYILLGGYPPFHDDDQRTLFKKIVRGAYQFHPAYWGNISSEAKDLIRGLLTLNPLNRLTVEQALQHSWIGESDSALAARNLDSNLAELRKFQAAKRWKKGINAVIAINKFKRVLSGLTKGSLGSVSIDCPHTLEARYDIGPQLGEGGYAVVKKGISKLTEQEVAIKVVKRNALDAKQQDALRSEVQLLQSLHHPNIVGSFDFFEEPDYFYVIMELVTGGELFDRIVQRKHYDEGTARDLALIFLSALQYLHQQDIVHRDLKPENLLLTSNSSDADLKIADFGFATKTHGSSLKDHCGTPGYIAPEILLDKPYGVSVDMWSFGVILYILLGGYPPFYDKNVQRLFRKIVSCDYVFHESYWKAVSEDAKDLIKKLLVVDPKKRFTVEQALQHPWLRVDSNELKNRDLSSGLSELRKFQAKRKLRAGIKAVIGLGRMQSLVASTRGNSQKKLDDTQI